MNHIKLGHQHTKKSPTEILKMSPTSLKPGYFGHHLPKTFKCIFQLGVIAEKENLVESLKAKDSKISELESSQSASSKSINDAQIKISELTSELD